MKYIELLISVTSVILSLAGFYYLRRQDRLVKKQLEKERLSKQATKNRLAIFSIRKGGAL